MWKSMIQEGEIYIFLKVEKNKNKKKDNKWEEKVCINLNGGQK